MRMRLDLQQSLKQIVDTCDIPSFELRLSEPKLRVVGERDGRGLCTVHCAARQGHVQNT